VADVTSPNSRLGGRSNISEESIEVAMNADTKKNKLFNHAKKEIEYMCSKLKPLVKDLNKYAETLKSNQQVFEAILNNRDIKPPTTAPDDNAERFYLSFWFHF